MASPRGLFLALDARGEAHGTTESDAANTVRHSFSSVLRSCCGCNLRFPAKLCSHVYRPSCGGRWGSSCSTCARTAGGLHLESRKTKGFGLKAVALAYRACANCSGSRLSSVAVSHCAKWLQRPCFVLVFLPRLISGLRRVVVSSFHKVAAWAAHLTTHSSGRRSIACALTNLASPAPLNSGVRGLKCRWQAAGALRFCYAS